MYYILNIETRELYNHPNRKKNGWDDRSEAKAYTRILRQYLSRYLKLRVIDEQEKGVVARENKEKWDKRRKEMLELKNKVAKN